MEIFIHNRNVSLLKSNQLRNEGSYSWSVLFWAYDMSSRIWDREPAGSRPYRSGISKYPDIAKTACEMYPSALAICSSSKPWNSVFGRGMPHIRNSCAFCKKRAQRVKIRLWESERYLSDWTHLVDCPHIKYRLKLWEQLPASLHQVSYRGFQLSPERRKKTIHRWLQSPIPWRTQNRALQTCFHQCWARSSPKTPCQSRACFLSLGGLPAAFSEFAAGSPRRVSLVEIQPLSQRPFIQERKQSFSSHTFFKSSSISRYFFVDKGSPWR